MKTFLKISVILIMMIGSFGLTCQSVADRKIQNIETFARLYGYARWFHPSDEAQEIDWNKFAVLGVQKVETAKSTKELQNTLYRLFSPIVQGLQIYETTKPEKFNPDDLLSPDPDARPVAWQHHGVWLSEESNAYKSERTNKRKFENKDAALVYKIFMNPSHLQGKDVKLTGYFKSQNKESAKLFIQYIQKNDNKIHDKLIESQNWEKHELTQAIPKESVVVAYGLWIVGNSEVGADDLEFLVKNGSTWEPADTVNMGFENGKIDVRRGNDWKTQNLKYCTYEVTDKDFHSGKYGLKLSFNFTGKIFDPMPQFSEIIKEPIGSNLTCAVPLTLLTNDSATYPKTKTSLLAQLKSEISKVDISGGFDLHANLASVVIAWNVLQHFFPYFDVIDTDWNQVLNETLKNTLVDTQKKDFMVTLSKMIAKLDDGHGLVSGEPMYHLPIRTELIENEIIITASKNNELKRGDIIKEMNGKPVMEVLAEMEKTISGSSQLKRHRALNVLGSKFDLDENNHMVVVRDGALLNITVSNKGTSKNISFNPIDERPYLDEKIVEIEPGIYYVNIANCTENNFYQKIDVLANAKAVIFDQRGGGGLNFIPYLIEKPVTSTWWNIPQTVYPNRKKVEFNKSNWDMQPKQPLFKSKAIIINVPAVVSSGETMMGIIDHYHLATTVGEATGGCNGNVNYINLPCGYKVRFTGMKVLKHDGSQLYLKGFQPDYPVNKTIQAIREGRDEYLEKALEIARGK